MNLQSENINELITALSKAQGYKEFSKFFGVSPMTIFRACNNKSWRHLNENI